METPPPKAVQTASEEVRMGKAMVQQPFFCTLSQAQAEFAKVGTAVRERLEREATGDLIGCRVAAQDSEAHRYGFPDIKRAISRLRSPSLASASAEAARNSFLPDASFLALSASPTRGASTTVGRQEAVIRIGYPAWDIYRPHEVRDRAGTEGAGTAPRAGDTGRVLRGMARRHVLKRSDEANGG
jgi:hypothetical protein